jgi:anaerobic selenocysteine-containing dehydrogenase
MPRSITTPMDEATASFGLGLRWWRERRGFWMRLAVPEPFVPFADGFPTPSGKLEFYTARMAEAGLDPLAGYTPPYEAAQRGSPLAARYPLALIAGAEGATVNVTVDERDADMGGGAVFHDNRVEIERLFG